MTIEQEAEEYRNKHPATRDGGNNIKIVNAFIAGHNSKATQAKVLQAQIDVFNDLLNKSENLYADICKYMIKKRNQLQQQLKELE